MVKSIAAYHLSRYIKLTILVWDIIVLNGAFVGGIWLRHLNINRLNHPDVRPVWFFAIFLWVVISFYKGANTLIRFERFEEVIGRVFKLLVMHALAISLFTTFLKYEDLSRLHLLFFYLLFAIGLIAGRLILTRLLKYFRSKGYNFRYVIVVGGGDIAQKLIDRLESDLSLGYRVLAQFFEAADQKPPQANKRTYLSIDALELYLTENRTHEMYVALNSESPEIIKRLIFLAEKYMVRIKFVPHFYTYTGMRKVSIDFYSNIPVMIMRKEPLENIFNRIGKKMFDVLFSLFVILFIFSWLFPLLMLVVKLSSPGPIFFKQLRTGENNEEFYCLKFRTMRVNKLADELQATAGDPRITSIGRIMRKTNLDELPQFFNVLTGSMSVVGPRPHMLKHTEQYKALIDNYLVRHFAKPGITGWAQVNGFRGETKELIDMQKRVEYDIWYIENWSFLLDIKIIWLTVYNMIKGEEKAG